jgi:hypothetical protein
MDKINRLNKPQATTGTLKYGLGDVIFNTNGEVAAFQITYRGKIRGTKKLREGWTIKIGKSKIVIFSMAQTELSELLFSYVGEFEIISCEYVDWNLESRHANIINQSKTNWEQSRISWESDSRKPEEIDKPKISRTIKKSVI